MSQVTQLSLVVFALAWSLAAAPAQVDVVVYGIEQDSTRPGTGHGNLTLEHFGNRPGAGHGNLGLQAYITMPGVGHGNLTADIFANRPATGHGN